MSDPPPPPVVSPDGKFYWDGQRWLPLHEAPQPSKPVEGKASRDLREIGLVLGVITLVLITGAGTIFLLNRGPSSSATQTGLVRADPKTLVAQGADWPSGDPVDPISGQPLTGQYPAGSGITPVDLYTTFIGGQSVESLVAIYGSVSEAQTAFTSIKLPSTRRSIDSYLNGLKVGDEQKAYSWNLDANTVEVEFDWRSGNVIAGLGMSQSTNVNYPTLTAVADNIDSFAGSTFAIIAPRIQTRIRLAVGE